MNQLQEKFLKAIEDNIFKDAFFIDSEEIGKRCEQICIEEKIELLKEIGNFTEMKYPSVKDVEATIRVKDFIAFKISELQNQLNNLK